MSPVRRWIIKWSRTIHLYVTLFGLALLLFFAVTGFMLNHDDWFLPATPHTRTAEGKLPADILGTPDPAEDEPTPEGADPENPPPEKPKKVLMNKLAVVERLRKDFQITGELVPFDEPAGAAINLEFRKPGHTVKVEIERGDDETMGKTTVTFESEGTAGVLMDLHKGKSAGKYWRLVIDIVAIIIVVVSVTGIILWATLKGRGRYGLLVILFGIGCALVVFFRFVP